MDTRLRLTVAASIALLPLVPLTVRLTKLQVMDHRSLASRAADEFSRVAEEVVPRGDILDRNGNVLAQSTPVWAVFVDKRMVPEPAPLARLAPILGISRPELDRRYRSAARFAWLSTKLTYEQSQAVSRARVEGVGVVARQERFYPTGTLARGLLGQTSSDGHGQSGVELAFDSQLAGKPIKLKVIRDGSGKLIYRSLEDSAPAPEPLRLTIDRSIQFFAEQALQDAEAKFHMPSGVVAVEDPRTGELLALASWPENPLHDPLIQDIYEPGSTFKLVTSAAALEEGVVTPDEKIFCENGAWRLSPGTVIHDDDKEGDLDLAGILNHSSNIGAAKIVLRLGAEKFYRYVRAFGFAAKTGLPLPGETAGQFRPLSQLTRVALATSGYGYGVGVSPVQLLGAYSTVANGGTLYAPQLVLGQGPERVRRVVSSRTTAEITRMLEGVVATGTGTAAKIPGYRIAGKTGTSRRIDPQTHRYSLSQYNASFAGFFPASSPRWAMLVVIQSPKGSIFGAQVAAPIFGEIAQRILTLYGVAPDALPLAPPASGLPYGGRDGSRPLAAPAAGLRPSLR